MTRDPIVAEIHRAREKIWKECGEDSRKFFDHLKAAEDENKGRAVSGRARSRRRAKSPQ
jgi:hypothetical protein